MLKRSNGLLAILALTVVVVLSSCSFGIGGSQIPAGTYVYESSSGTWTVVLERASFTYMFENSLDEQMVGWRGEFDGLDDLGEDEYSGDLTKLEEWTSGTTYTPVTLSGQTVKFTYWSDYPLDDVDAKAISFFLDTNGDGSYTNTGGGVTVLGMNLQ